MEYTTDVGAESVEAVFACADGTHQVRTDIAGVGGVSARVLAADAETRFYVVALGSLD